MSIQEIQTFLQEHQIPESIYIDPVELNHSGWWPLLCDTFLQLKEAGWDGKLSQNSAKYGLLHLQTAKFHPDFYQIIQEAKKKSASLCDKCGSSGIYYKTDELRVRCDTHKNGRFFYKKDCTCLTCNVDRKRADSFMEY